MSGNGWRLPSQSYQVQQIEYFPFICCWCHHSFMDIEALINHHEAHLMLLQNQVQTYYSAALFRPQRGGNFSMNPFRSILPLPDTTATIRAPTSNNSVGVQPGQFSLPYHQPVAGSSATQSHLPLLRGINGSRQHAVHSPSQVERQRGTDKGHLNVRPLNVTPRQHAMRPPQQMARQGRIERQPSKAAPSQHDQVQPPPVEQLQGQNKGASNVTIPLIDLFGRPEPVATDQYEEANETLDLTLSLRTPYQ